MDKLHILWEGSGLYNLEVGQAAMIAVGLLLLYLAIYKKFEPLLLVPIGFSGILANIPEAGLAISALDQAIEVAKPAVLSQIASALGATLDPLAGVEAWRESLKAMAQLRPVSKLEKIVFPLMLLILVALFLPDAAPLLGMFCFGNLMRECGVVERLSDTAQNALINIVTIILGLSVGSKLMAESFLSMETLGILGLGIVAFGIGTAAGVLMAKLMNLMNKMPINPLIGAAGVSAVPMAARVANKVGGGIQPAQLPADACDGAQCSRGHRLGGGRRGDDQVLELRE